MKLIIIGPQASGKGTQSEMLSKELGLTHISIGERLRQEIASQSRLGKEIKAKIAAGEMVDDRLVEHLVKKLIAETGKGFILDGFPRDKEQAEWLDLVANIDKVIVLQISDKTAIERISGRRECPKGHDFHIIYNPPKKKDVCDECGLPLKKREDDTTTAIMKRLQTYHQVTEPILSHYTKKIVKVNGEQSIKDVHFAILKAIHKHPPKL